MKLSQIADIVCGRLKGDPDTEITGCAPFESAGQKEITWAGGAKFLKRIGDCRAGAVIVPQGFADPAYTGNLLEVKQPHASFARVLQQFHQPGRPSYIREGVSPNAQVDETATIGKGAAVGPYTVVGKNTCIGDRTVIHPGTVIGDDVEIGNDVEIHPNVTICMGSIIGDRTVIHAGTVIGSDGFGFAPEGQRYLKIPHSGIVEIAEDVEIGAGNTIDRGTFGKTRIMRGVKTDNQVHIAHNVAVGEDTLLVAQVGIAGSTTIGNHAVLAGQVGVSGHIHIGDNAVIGPKSGVAGNVSAGNVVSGIPEMPHRIWLKVMAILPRLPEIYKKVRELEKQIMGTGR